MDSIVWPDNFPEMDAMFELIQKTAKASWRNDEDISSAEIEEWLDNFTGEVYKVEDEKRLALWLLCNFTYYNMDEIDHLCHVVFKHFIHDLAVNYNVQTDDEMKHLLDNVYFAAMGDASESGGLLLYHFRQQSDLSIEKFYYPSAIPKDEKGIIVYIDDVTLSGRSASTFIKNNMKGMKYERAYYLTLFASQAAIDKIRELGFTMIQSTILGDRERCFSDDSLAFADFPTLREASKSMVESYGRKINGSCPLGFKDGQYCFGMYYNTPNNTLPIFWSNKSWTPIFPRKEKRRNDRKIIDFDKFI